MQSSLRDFGFGKVRKGEMLKEEAKMLVEAVELAASGMDGAQGVVQAQVRMLENKLLGRPRREPSRGGCLCCGRLLTADFVQGLLRDAVVNVLWRMVAGERLEYGDPKLADLVAKVGEVSKSTFPMPR